MPGNWFLILVVLSSGEWVLSFLTETKQRDYQQATTLDIIDDAGRKMRQETKCDVQAQLLL